jgi:uroporphyrinogen decarboxylase
MGLPLQFVAGEGPVINTPVRSLADVEKLKVRPAAEALPFTLEAIRMVCRELDNRVPLIGFSGAPFTLACYAVEGGSSREFDFTRSFMFSEPKAWHALMEKLAESVGEYLSAQAAAGAQALQVFDSWAGSLSPADFREYVLPHTKRTIELAKQNGVPVIYFSTRTAGMLPELRELGADVYGLDWRLDLPSAWAALGDVAIQGNLDPTVLLSNPGEIRRHTARVLDSVRGRPGYIFNIGHGVIKETPEDHVKILVDYVHEHRTA